MLECMTECFMSVSFSQNELPYVSPVQKIIKLFLKIIYIHLSFNIIQKHFK